MKALDELRGWIDSLYTPNSAELKVRGESIADAIEAEIAERYMELPVDADGVPIHVGDKMEYIATDPFMVCAVAPGVIHAWAKTNPGERKTTEVYPTAQCRHVKPRTIEDVLRDCCNEWNEHLGNDWESGVYAKYAAELRELIGGGE